MKASDWTYDKADNVDANFRVTKAGSEQEQLALRPQRMPVCMFACLSVSVSVLPLVHMILSLGALYS